MTSHFSQSKKPVNQEPSTPRNQSPWPSGPSAVTVTLLTSQPIRYLCLRLLTLALSKCHFFKPRSQARKTAHLTWMRPATETCMRVMCLSRPPLLSLPSLTFNISQTLLVCHNRCLQSTLPYWYPSFKRDCTASWQAVHSRSFYPSVLEAEADRSLRAQRGLRTRLVYKMRLCLRDNP